MKIYSLDDRCLPAIEKVRNYYLSQPEWQKDIAEGKMFGVLIYKDKDVAEDISYLAAFSGTLGGKTCQPGFVPPIFDIQEGDGRYFLKEEAEISAINKHLDSGKASAWEICELRFERKNRSRALQRWLFSRYTISNACGEQTNLLDIFAPSVPPGGAGDCCAPKLLQEAYRKGIKPLAIAEWNSADNKFYPPCISRCRPILAHMLKGLNAEEDPRLMYYNSLMERLKIIFEDEFLMVIEKPSGLLSVPGKNNLPSVESITKCLSVHRLDQDTSGLMVLAKTFDIQRELRSQFEQRITKKQYDAVLEREMTWGEEGEITLPLCPDISNRPRQVIDFKNGKDAKTHYRVEKNINGHAYIKLWPLTGRTHQLRVHMAKGLGNPILGDRLYGTNSNGASSLSSEEVLKALNSSERLMLNASQLIFLHPVSKKQMCFTCTPEWLVVPD